MSGDKTWNGSLCWLGRTWDGPILGNASSGLRGVVLTGTQGLCLRLPHRSAAECPVAVDLAPMPRPLARHGLAVTRSLCSLQHPRVNPTRRPSPGRESPPRGVAGVGPVWAAPLWPSQLPSGATPGSLSPVGISGGPWRGARFAVGLVTHPLPLQGADGAGVQDEGHAHGQDGAGLPACHRPLQPRYGLLPRSGRMATPSPHVSCLWWGMAVPPSRGPCKGPT